MRAILIALALSLLLATVTSASEKFCYTVCYPDGGCITICS